MIQKELSNIIIGIYTYIGPRIAAVLCIAAGSFFIGFFIITGMAKGKTVKTYGYKNKKLTGSAKVIDEEIEKMIEEDAKKDEIDSEHGNTKYDEEYHSLLNDGIEHHANQNFADE